MQAIRRRFTIWPVALTVLALFATLVISDGASPPPAYAATIIVNSNADTIEDNGSCTLREAIIAANTNTASGIMVGECLAGGFFPDTITFNGDFVITVTGSALPPIVLPVTIDGTTQNITLDGSLAPRATAGLTINPGEPGKKIKGLNIFGFPGAGIAIQGSPSNVIGGTKAPERNVISGNGAGIVIVGAPSMGNVVTGNYIGTDAAGTSAMGNLEGGVEIISASDNIIGGTTPAERNVISGNGGNGVAISGSGATGNMVEGNYIGTDAAGTADLGNAFAGVFVGSAPNNTIGGNTAAERNVISGNGLHGIRISGSSAMGNKVYANYIGTDASGTGALANSGSGVLIDGGASGNTIGGTAPGEGNTIAFNTQDGVRVSGATTINNAVRGNSIHSNVGAGINNFSGGNRDLAPPTVTSVGSAAGKACNGCTVYVYSDADGEGEVFEGTTTAADGSGRWSFAGTVTGPFVTATATDAAGNTSEFSSPPLAVCTQQWPSTTVNTFAKGQSAANNAKLSHAITGHIVEPGALGPTASRIRICEGSTVSINITDSSGTPTVTGICTSTACTIPSLAATEKYKAVSGDGTDTDRVTLIPVP